MDKYRESMDIIVDVLKAAGAGASKTRIMNRVKLSCTLLEKCLELTVANGFLLKHGLNYEITVTGREFLHRYSAFCDDTPNFRSSLKVLLDARDVLNQSYPDNSEKKTNAKFSRYSNPRKPE